MHYRNYSIEWCVLQSRTQLFLYHEVATQSKELNNLLLGRSQTAAKCFGAQEKRKVYSKFIFYISEKVKSSRLIWKKYKRQKTGRLQENQKKTQYWSSLVCRAA